jgi:hypothetical protein
MNRNFAALALAATIFASSAQAEDKAAAPMTAEAAKPAFSTATTTIGDILDNAEAKAIVEKHLPGFSSHPQIDQARGFSLKVVQGFAPDQITDELLAKIDADFAAMAAKK